MSQMIRRRQGLLRRTWRNGSLKRIIHGEKQESYSQSNSITTGLVITRTPKPWWFPMSQRRKMQGFLLIGTGFDPVKQFWIQEDLCRCRLLRGILCIQSRTPPENIIIIATTKGHLFSLYLKWLTLILTKPAPTSTHPQRNHYHFHSHATFILKSQ